MLEKQLVKKANLALGLMEAVEENRPDTIKFVGVSIERGLVLSCRNIVQTGLLRLNLDTRLWLQLMCCAHLQCKVPQF